MASESDLIRRQLEETRESLATKITALENQVVGAVQGTTAAVTDTVAAVQESVTTVKDAVAETACTVKDTVAETVGTVQETVVGTVETVKSTVRETLDFSGQFEKHPWACLAASVAVGFVGGHLLNALTARSQPAAPQSRAIVPTASPPPEPASSVIAPVVEQVKQVALSSLVGVLTDVARESLPDWTHEHVNTLAQGVSAGLGVETTAAPPPPPEQTPWDQRRNTNFEKTFQRSNLN